MSIYNILYILGILSKVFAYAIMAYMDRRKIEQFTASLAVTLLFVATIGAILAIANTVFNWNIFPPSIEKLVWFIFGSCIIIVISSVMVNIMINISIIAINSTSHKKIGD